MDYQELARPAVRSLHPYRAGTTIDQARRTFGLDRVIKLSSNENPLGASPLAMAAIRTIPDAHLYVDDDHPLLRERLGAPFGLGVENVIVGHGSNELLLLFFLTFLGPGDEVVMADPTFSLFPADARIVDASAVRVPVRPDGVHDLDAMLAAVGPRTKAVIVCDPNNPTSTCVEPAAFARFAQALPERVLLFLDQAYREYMPAASVEGAEYVRRRPGTIVTRTMSKLYGLASLRFGYGLADEGMIELMQRVRLPFNVSRPAALAALAALDDDAFRRRTIEMNTAGRAFLAAAFARLGLSMMESAANFVALRVPVAAEEAYVDLLRAGIVTRSGDRLSFPHHLRITIGTPDENHALVDALEAVLPVWQQRTPAPA